MLPIRTEGLELVGDIIETAQGFDDDAFDAQIIAPDLLDEFGIVFALDPDPRPARHPGFRTDYGARARSRPSGLLRLLLRQLHIDGLSLEEETRPQWKDAHLADAVLELYDDTGRGLLRADDGTDIAAHRILENHAQAELDLTGLLRTVRRRRGAGEHIGAITIKSIHGHPP